MCQPRPGLRCGEHSAIAYTKAVSTHNSTEEGTKIHTYAEKRRDAWGQHLRLAAGWALTEGKDPKDVAKEMQANLQKMLEDAGISPREARNTASAVFLDFREHSDRYHTEAQARLAKAKGGTAHMLRGEKDGTKVARLSNPRVVVEDLPPEEVSLSSRSNLAATTEDVEVMERGVKAERSIKVLTALAKNPNLPTHLLEALLVRVHATDRLRKTPVLLDAVRSNPSWSKSLEHRAVVDAGGSHAGTGKRIAKGTVKIGAALAKEVHRATFTNDFDVMREMSLHGKRTVKLALLTNKAVTKGIVATLASSSDSHVVNEARKHRLYEPAADIEAKKATDRERQRAYRAAKKKGREE